MYRSRDVKTIINSLLVILCRSLGKSSVQTYKQTVLFKVILSFVLTLICIILQFCHMLISFSTYLLTRSVDYDMTPKTWNLNHSSAAVAANWEFTSRNSSPFITSTSVWLISRRFTGLLTRNDNNIVLVKMNTVACFIWPAISNTLIISRISQKDICTCACVWCAYILNCEIVFDFVSTIIIVPIYLWCGRMNFIDGLMQLPVISQWYYYNMYR